MEGKKPDRRVLKTKRAIRNALAQLLVEKELDEITVKDVADTADINRKTFYNYYTGIHQVIDELESGIVFTFAQAIREVDARRDIKNPYTFFEKITAILNQDLDFYSHLFRMRGNLSLFYKITTLLKTKILTSFLQEHSCDPQEAEIFVEYAVWGMMAVYESWFNSRRGRRPQKRGAAFAGPASQCGKHSCARCQGAGPPPSAAAGGIPPGHSAGR